jgi:hypothetical protein
VLNWYQSEYQNKIIELLNFEELHGETKIDLVAVYENIKRLFHFIDLLPQIKQTGFYRKLNNENLIVESPN